MRKEGMLPVPGGRIWYKAFGEGGTPLVVLHGGPGATHEYLEPLQTLADERTVVFYDQLGGGRSDRPTDASLWTMDRFVQELDLLIGHLGLDAFHLLGSSWGATLAVLFAIQKGQTKIASMVLSGPCLSSEVWARDTREMVDRLPERHRQAITDCEAREDFTSPAYAEAMDVFYRRHLCRMDEWPECLTRSLGNMGADVYRAMWGPSEFTIDGNMKGMDLTPLLGQLRVPVLYTCGEFDEATPRSVRHFADLTPGSRAIVFPGASHSHHLEREGEYISAVRSFLLSTDRTLRPAGRRTHPRSSPNPRPAVLSTSSRSRRP